MNKWYESGLCSDGVIIGGQVCMVRNLVNFPFPSKMTPQQQQELIGMVYHAVKECEASLQKHFDFIDLSGEGGKLNKALICKLAVPPQMLEERHHCALLISEDESVSILIGGSEHICMQISVPGAQIQQAFEMANLVDDQMNHYLEYAFNEKYGYLTGNPLLVGTGLSASYLVHIPYLEKKAMVGRFQKEYGQYGYSLNPQFRGDKGVVGCIYRLKNKKTLGLSEHEIISTLKHLAAQIVREEEKATAQIYEHGRLNQEDMMFRAYGLMRYARTLSCEETLDYMSWIRLANKHHVWKNKDASLIFKTLLGCQTALLSEKDGKIYSEIEAETVRAQYIQKALLDICGEL